MRVAVVAAMHVAAVAAMHVAAAASARCTRPASSRQVCHVAWPLSPHSHPTSHQLAPWIHC